MKLCSSEEFVRSICNDAKRNKKVSLLLGSAVSFSSNGAGVPNVSGVVDIVRQYISQQGIGDDIDLKVLNGASAYQKCFDYLLSVGDQSDVSEVIKNVVLRAKNKDVWHIPKAISDIALLIKNKIIDIDYILTTNFDPLIEEALKLQGVRVNTHVVDSDTNIESTFSYNERTVGVVHLHGFWQGDTMHTPSQLLANREKVKLSLKSILGNSKLYVIGYGGWDDIFISSISEIVQEYKGKYDIRWGFYSNSDAEILHENANLIKHVQPAIAKARFNGYKGIDCHSVFESVYNKFTQINKIGGDEFEKDTDPDEKTKIISLPEIYNPKRPVKNIYLKEYKLYSEPSHDSIRIFEKSSALSYLENYGCFHLESSWGGGKIGFISSVLVREEESLFCMRVDLSGIESKEKAQEKFFEDVGCDITTLFASVEQKKLVVILDNIESTNSNLRPYLSEIASIVKDYKNNVNAIFVSNCQIDLGCEKVKIKELSIDDVKSYILHDTFQYTLNSEKLDKLFHLTSGLPAKIDKLKDYLKIMPINDIIEDGNIEISNDVIKENIPNVLLNMIDDFSKSENPANIKIFSLLKIFSVLECGESAKSIIRFYYNLGFNIDDFHRLNSLGLIYPIKKNEPNELVVLKVNPLIKHYIISLISPEELYLIHCECLGIVLGKDWKSFQAKISSTSKQMLMFQEFFPGNIHVLLIGAMKFLSFKNGHHDKGPIMNAAISYCLFLKNESQYKDLVGFSRSIYKFIKQDENINKFKVALFLSEGLRMIDEEQESIELISSICENFKEKKFFEKSLYQEMLGTLALAHSSIDDDKAYVYAKILQESSPSKSQNRYLADSILAEKSTGDIKLRKLKKIEKDARNNGHVLVANNVSLSIVSINPDIQDRYINAVLNTEKNTYTRIRALLLKAEKLVSADPDDFMKSQYFQSCVEAYRYLFIQRVDGLFGRCHSILWKAFTNKARFSDLYILFKTSSLIWRLNGSYEVEFKYASILRDMALDSVTSKREYVIFVNNRYEHIANRKNSNLKI